MKKDFDYVNLMPVKNNIVSLSSISLLYLTTLLPSHNLLYIVIFSLKMNCTSHSALADIQHTINIHT